MARSCPLRVFKRYFMGTPSAQECLKAVSKTFYEIFKDLEADSLVSDWVTDIMKTRDAYASKKNLTILDQF